MPYSILSGALAACLYTGAAYSQASAEIKINGTITPPACRLNLDKDALNMGNHAYAGLKDTGTSLGLHDIKLTVSCDGPAFAAWSVSDNRRGTQIDTTRVPENEFPSLAVLNGNALFGLGTTGPDAVGIGAMKMAIKPGVLVDNKALGGTEVVIAARSLASIFNNTAGRSVNKTAYGIEPGLLFTPGNRTNDISTARRFTSAEFPLVLHPLIAPRNQFPATEQIKLDGSLTFTLQYL